MVMAKTYEEMGVRPVKMPQITLDGTVLHGASLSWSKGGATTSIFIGGCSSYEEACNEVIEQAKRMGWTGGSDS